MARVVGWKRWVGVAIGSLMVPCGAAAETIEVDVQFHNSIDLAVCRTWTWAKGTPAANYQVEAALREEIESQMAKKGAIRIETDGGCVVATASQRAEIFPSGTLAIEIYDAASERLAWSAVAAAIITDNDSKKVAKVARKAVKEAFKKFPRL